MSIKDAQAFVDSIWDWGILKGCFGDSKIEPTDVDGLVERCGNFLIFETKLPWAKIPLGQKILFDAYVAVGNTTVLIVWGHPGKPEHYQIWKRTEKLESNLECLRKYVSKWYEFANDPDNKK